jgi:phenylpyruvate tautomerase PptA (4-oxalocrotonate tautomerase family)
LSDALVFAIYERQQAMRSAMPLARIAVPAGKSPAFRKAVSDSVHRALIETFNVPKDDLFHVITEHQPGTGLVHTPSYLGIEYSDDLVFIQITVSDTRSVEQKKQLFRRIADHMSEAAGLRREDIFINLVEVKKENWSFGLGEAQYA